MLRTVLVRSLILSLVLAACSAGTSSTSSGGSGAAASLADQCRQAQTSLCDKYVGCKGTQTAAECAAGLTARDFTCAGVTGPNAGYEDMPGLCQKRITEATCADVIDAAGRPKSFNECFLAYKRP